MILNTGQRTDIPAFYGRLVPSPRPRRLRHGEEPFQLPENHKLQNRPRSRRRHRLLHQEPRAHAGKTGRTCRLPPVLARHHHALRQRHRTQRPACRRSHLLLQETVRESRKRKNRLAVRSYPPHRNLHTRTPHLCIQETWQKNSKAAQNPASFPSSTSTRKPSGTSPKQKESATKSSTAWQKEWQR